MSNTALQVFNATAQVPAKVRELAGGARSVTYISKKEYGEKFGLRGKELARRHEQYRFQEFGLQGNAGLAVQIATGAVVSQKQTFAKDNTGFTVKFVYASEFENSDPRAVAATLSEEQLMELVTAKREARGAADTTGNI